MIKEAKKPLILAGGINHSKSNHLLTEFVTRHSLQLQLSWDLERYLIIAYS